ncbi:MAG: type II toxin-antitoxin system RelE/ParE family toxin, partial [Sulfurovum sp.]
ENKGSRFYFEEKNIFNLKIIDGYNFGDALKSIKPEISRTLHLFMKQQCNSDCLNKMSDEEIENIIDSNLYFDDEKYDSQKYLILSYSLSKKTFLLSFGKNRWKNYKIIASKVEESGNSEKVILDNIANKEHVVAHYNQKQLDKLPNQNIIYSDSFKNWLLTNDVSSTEKIISKINKCVSMEFVSDGFLLKKLQDGDVWQIRIGTEGGLQESAMRVLYKYDEKNCIYILWYVVKQGERDYNYSSDIKKANSIFEEMKKKEKYEI